MGNLIKETPYSEVTATLEVLDNLGVTPEHFKKIRSDADHAQRVAAAMLGEDEKTKSLPANQGQIFTVDYSVKPSLVNLEVESHPDRKDVVTYDITKFERVLTLKSGDDRITGHENLKRLKATGKTLLDVRVMEELLKHPNLIPEEWKNGYTYFWGTIFRDSDGRLCVPYLYWHGGGWGWDDRWLGYGWSSSSPAACLASK